MYSRGIIYRRPGENGLSGGYMYECFSEPSCVQFAERVRCRLRKPEPENHRGVCFGVYAMAALIILATVFLKQHSVVDVFGATIMAYILYQFIYAPAKKSAPRYAKQKGALLQNK